MGGILGSTKLALVPFLIPFIQGSAVGNGRSGLLKPSGENLARVGWPFLAKQEGGVKCWRPWEARFGHGGLIAAPFRAGWSRVCTMTDPRPPPSRDAMGGGQP